MIYMYYYYFCIIVVLNKDDVKGAAKKLKPHLILMYIIINYAVMLNFRKKVNHNI